jgi:cyclopropane-fatty-acyl-phospholipid synthase
MSERRRIGELLAERRGAAERLAPVVCQLFGIAQLPVRLRCWDGSEAGPSGGPVLVIRSRRALRRLIWASDEVGLGRAYVSGDLDVDGDLYELLRRLSAIEGTERLTRRLSWRERGELLATALRLGAIGPNPMPPPEEAPSLNGARHSPRRDRQAISHHYDVGNDFYRLVLGPTMAYSCAVWEAPDVGLDAAQTAKHDLVARKLGLREGMRLLDVGCGWGSMVLHAAERYGVQAVGVTLSDEQATLARKRVAEAGLSDRIEIRVQDYRDVTDGPYDAICSIGMAEHVGREQMVEYARDLYTLLRPGGRLLNHAIGQLHRTTDDRETFISRYVFPDGELLTIGQMVSVLEGAAFEIRDVEALREHYGLTLREWTRRLDRSWDEAVRLTSEGRARVWRLYMTGSALGFDSGRIGVNQVLCVKPSPGGRSGMPWRRTEYLS